MRAKTRNRITIEDDTAFIHCVHFGELYAVPISICDAEPASEHKWSIGENRDGYKFVQTSSWTPGVGQRTIRLVRFLLNAPRDREVDHIDRNPLNCRRSNLRFVTRAQNRQNLSPSGQGVFHTRGVTGLEGRYLARVTLGGKMFKLGWFHDFEAAREVVVRFRAEHMPFSPEALARKTDGR